VCGAAAWKWRAQIGRKLDLHQDVTAVVTVTDPHGLHMRRCKDLVNVARRNITYRVLVRPQSGSRRTWADARSILSIHSLGVRGARAGEAPPALEIRVQGFRPRHVLREIRETLEGEPHKYLSPLEIYELAQKTGGRLVVAVPKQKPGVFANIIQCCRDLFLKHFLR
jgi:phosphotransferase system HPr-like phosphotransfer protein